MRRADTTVMLSSETIADRVRELPALPAALMELIHSLSRDDLSAEQLAGKIANDQALAAATLRLANSSFYGLSRQVTTITEAATVLGLRTLRQLATAAGLAGAFPGGGCAQFDFSAFWRHSIGTALCAQALAQALHRDADTAFIVGLLHDIGRLALASRFPAELGAVLQRQHDDDGPMLEAERAVLGADHGRIGGLIAEHWRFPSEVAAAIATHHDPQAADGDAATASLADLVHVADNMAHALDLSGLEDDSVPPLALCAWSRLALDEALCLHVLREAQARHEAVCQAVLNARSKQR